MMKPRSVLKAAFKKGLTPKESDFADLIDSVLIQDEDNLSKLPNEPLTIKATGANEALLTFSRVENTATKPTWKINQKAGDTFGLNIADAAGTSRLFIDSATGNVGIGTTTPVSKLDIAAVARTSPANHPAAVKGLYITGDFGSDADGVEFRHSNGSQGIGLGFNTIYAAGSNAAQDLNLKTKNGIVNVTGRVAVSEATGTVNSANSGTLVLDHENSGGASSIVFRSKVNRGSDYGFIQYQDAATVGGTGESALLTIGISNDRDDHIALMPSGNVGIGTPTPSVKLDVNGVVRAASTFNVAKDPDSGLSNGGALVIKSNAPQIDFIDTDHNDWAIHVNSNRMYFIRQPWNYTDLVLDGAGNVGIGTESPGAKLQVAGPVMQQLEMIRCNNRDDWPSQNHPIMQYFKTKLTGQPIGTYIKAIQDHPAWRGHYWQGWVDADGHIRVIHNNINTGTVVS
jgi:hypothetical protein